MITCNTRNIETIVKRSRTGVRLTPRQRGWFIKHFDYGQGVTTLAVLTEYRAYARHCATNSYRTY